MSSINARVPPLRLMAVDTPADGEVAAYQSSSGEFQWVASGGGFTSFTVAGDAGASQTITDGNTLTLQGSGSITKVTMSATDTATISLENTAVTPGSYTYASVTVDAQGRLTAASSGTAPSDTTYDLAAAQSGSDAEIQLDASSGTDTAVKLAAGSNITLTESGGDTITIAASSGGGTPGGSDTQLQYNDGGSFGGAAAITYTDTAGSEQLLIDDTSDQPLVKIVQQGTGSAFEVHDQATDTTIFAVTSTGEVLVGYAAGTGTALKFLVSGSAGADSFRAASDGTAGAPAFTRTNESDTGLFFPATNNTISISTAGSERFRFGASGELLISGTDAGTNGQVLTSGGSSAAPSWATAGNDFNVELCGTELDATGTGYPVFDVMAMPPYGVARFTTANIDTKQYFFPFISPFTGDVAAMSYNITSVASSATNLYLAIYADNNGVPSTVEGYATIDATVSGAQSTTSFSSTITLTRGVQYYISYNKSTTESITIRGVDNAYCPRIAPSENFPSTTNGYFTSFASNSTVSTTPAAVTADDLEGGVYFSSLGVKPHIGLKA